MAQSKPARLRASPRPAEATKSRRGRPPGKAKGPRGTPGPIASHMAAGFVPAGRIAKVLGMTLSTVIRQIQDGLIAAKDLGDESAPRTSYRWLVDVVAFAEKQRAALPPGCEVLERTSALLREIDEYAAAHAVAHAVAPLRKRIATILKAMARDQARASAG